MWIYEKKLEFPVNIKKKDLRMAKYLLTQYGGPDGELAAALRYLSQRYTMPTNKSKALLTDIGTEELAHVEMISAMVYQLIQDATPDELAKAGLGDYYSVHGDAVFPVDSAGNPFTAAYFQALGDVTADLTEDMAAEQKARATYERLINLTDDPDLIEPLRFLRQREVVHFQRFGEALDDVQFYYDHKRVF
ncbi:spore coat protein JC [Natranaerovirga hydrolytica]|uniref:Spore coat protein JC n=1 Tax=Natranaerovirga hydrolytica TaxID=680378 RepID=A0A4R1N369_9FIRM|nr:manganese catalase family protein [Natranaerovirga hydrolytica]TCK98474.1 spore coat protein JC [Natranaerovirga hydrolytica]